MPELSEMLKKTILTGIGLALVAKDEMEELAQEFEKKMGMSEQDGKKFLSELQDKYEDAQQKLEERVEKAVKDVLKKADIVTGEELKALKKEIRDLKKLVSQETETAE